MKQAQTEEWGELNLINQNHVVIKTLTDQEIIDYFESDQRCFRISTELVLENISELKDLKKLKIAHFNIGDVGVRKIAKLQDLTSLSLNGNGIGDDGAREIAKLHNLTSLSLNGNRIGNDGAREIAKLKKLTFLSLFSNNIGDVGTQEITQITNLTSLSLSANKIGDDGLRFIDQLANLTSLNLNWNNIGNKGLLEIAKLQDLTSLSLNGNNIGDEVAWGFAQLQNLTFLSLDGNKIGVEGARKIAKLQKLTSLSFDRNQIGDEGARAIAQLKNLTFLNLDNNLIGTEGVQSIAQLKNLTSLKLDRNNIGDMEVRAIARLQNLTSLSLDGNKVGAKGAQEIVKLEYLTSLSLYNNNIGVEGARLIAHLSNLTYLKLARNNLGDEGARAIAQLPNLIFLNLERNQIGDWGVRGFAKFKNLRSLNLDRNEIGVEGARSISHIPNLTSLSLSRNKIGAKGGRAIAQLKNLTTLNLLGNNLGDEGAQSIAQLQNLTSLNLVENNIGVEGAQAIAQLQNLTSLNLSVNKIGTEGARVLLDSLLSIENINSIRELGLQNNNISEQILPSEVLEISDAQSILAVYRRFLFSAKHETLQPLNEAKLLIVGHEFVGKTSLIKYLIDQESCDENEKKTEGVEIREKIDTKIWFPESENIILNVWDFGGQLMMHQTHRFFFTQRSLYLIVLSDRCEDDSSIYTWLKTIRSHGKDSPVIVIINKSDDGKADLKLNEIGLKKAYPNIIYFHRTSCLAGEYAKESIDVLRTMIVTAFSNEEQFEDIRKPIPKSWKRVKDTLSSQSAQERVLKHTDFIKICEDPNLKGTDEFLDDSDEQRALLRLLNDLGCIVAHGLDNNSPAAFKEITLLDPNWLTDAIYKLLNSRLIRDQNGEFSKHQMQTLLDCIVYPPETYEFILSMMGSHEIGLCFEIPNSHHEMYLIPEALSPNEPEYENFVSDSLRFRYKYDFLPPGLLPRFIVQSYHNMTEKKTLWKTGVVLKAAQCQILVKGNIENKQVDINVVGKPQFRRSALNIILNNLEIVHRLFKEADAEARVPLSDQPEIDVGYDHLLKLEARYTLDYKFDPEDADRAYSVGELLEGVRRENNNMPEELEDQTLHRKRFDSFTVGNNSQVIIGDGGQNYNNPVSMEQSSSNSSSKTSWIYMIAYWPFLSASVGIGTAILILLLILLPSNEWRAYIGFPLVGGLITGVWMLFRDPKYYYRRMLSMVISGGIIITAGGVTLSAYIKNELGQGYIQWNGAVSIGFYFVWAIAITALVVADLFQNTRHDP